MRFLKKLFGLGPRPADECIQRGLTHYKKGEYDLAVAQFTEAIQHDPKNSNAYRGRWLAYQALGDETNAASDKRRLQELDGSQVSASPSAADYIRRGQAAESAGDYDKAIGNYNEAIHLDRNNADAYKNRGEAYYKKGEYDHATADFSEAVRLDPGSNGAYLARGLAFHMKQDWEKAIADYTKAIQLSVDDPKAFYGRGKAFHAKELYDLALADYSMALEYYQANASFFATCRLGQSVPGLVHPMVSSVLHDRGAAYISLGQSELAIRDFTKAIELEPKCEYYLDRAFIYLQGRDWDRAIGDLTEAIRLDSAVAKCWHRRAIAYLGKGEADCAIADCTRVIQDMPSPTSAAGPLPPVYADAYADRGTAFFMKKEYARAIADYTEALALEPRLALVYEGRARAYRAIGDRQKATRDEQRARELSS